MAPAFLKLDERAIFHGTAQYAWDNLLGAVECVGVLCGVGRCSRIRRGSPRGEGGGGKLK